MPVPIWGLALGAAAGAALLLTSGKSKAATPKPSTTVPKTTTPVTPAKPATVFAPDTAAVALERAAAEARGSVFKTDPATGSIVQHLPAVTVTSGPNETDHQALVATQKDPLNVRNQPSSAGTLIGKVNRSSIVNLSGPIIQGPGSKKGWVAISQGTIKGFASVDYLDMPLDYTGSAFAV